MKVHFFVVPAVAQMPPPVGMLPIQLSLTGGPTRKPRAEISFLKKGHFACFAPRCRVTVSFDGGEPVVFRALPAPGHAMASIAIPEGRRMFEKACRAREIVVELELTGGRQQFRFNTDRLQWNPKDGHGPEVSSDCRASPPPITSANTLLLRSRS